MPTPREIANRLCEEKNVSFLTTEQRENQTFDETISRILRLYYNEELVPVICEDMYEYKDPNTGKRQSLHSYMIEKIIEKHHREHQTICLQSEQELIDILSEGYYGVQLLEEKIGKCLYDEIEEIVLNEKSVVREGICLKQEVEDFLNAGAFPKIVTTNCFKILETRLNKLDYKPVFYELDKKDSELPSRCVYHLFGEAKSGDEHWGYNDKQVLAFLRSIYSKDYEPIHLFEYIQKPKRKTLLFLGNNTPDWLFRFILVPIYGDVYDSGKGYYINDLNRKNPESLDHFLKDIHFVKESQLVTVLERVTASLSPQSEEKPTGHNKKYNFFISHASEDSDKVKALIDWLDNNNIIKADHIWADVGKSNMIKDGKYWQKIIDGIENSAYFMPFITPNYMKKISQKDEVKNALKEIKELPLDSNEALKLDGPLKPVHIELLLASRYFKENHQENDTYSIPVFIEGCEFSGDLITEKRLKLYGESSFLPNNLFHGVKAHGYDGEHPEKLELDWADYKSKEELGNGI